jgi:hypothetical protein
MRPFADQLRLGICGVFMGLYSWERSEAGFGLAWRRLRPQGLGGELIGASQ